MRKSKIIPIVCMFFVFIGIVICLVSRHRSEGGAIFNTVETTIDAEKEFKQDDTPLKGSANRQRLRQLVKNIKSSKPTPPERDEAFENPLNMTPEQIKKEKTITKKISHVLFENAPVLLEDMLQEQKLNSAWGKRVQETLISAFEDEKYDGTVLQDVDCRETLCKTTLNIRDAEAMEYFRGKGMELSPWDGDQIAEIKPAEDGHATITIYFSDPNKGPQPFVDMRHRMLAMLEKSELPYMEESIGLD